MPAAKGSRGAKSHGRRYSPKERAQALTLYRDIGPSAASRKLGIPYQTLKRWAQEANIVDQVAPSMTPAAQTARAHAMVATRTAGTWADFREEEALAAGAAAELVRDRLLDLLPGEDSQMLRAVTDAYDKLIANAERLSGQATERIQLWAQTDLDRELRTLVSELEDRVREQPPSQLTITVEPPPDQAEIIDVAELVNLEP